MNTKAPKVKTTITDALYRPDIAIKVERIELYGGGHTDIAHLNLSTWFETYKFDVNLGAVKAKNFDANLTSKLIAALRTHADKNAIGARVACQYAAFGELNSENFGDIIDFAAEIEKRLEEAAHNIELMTAANTAKAA